MSAETHLCMLLDSLENLPENQLPDGYRFAVCTEKTSKDYETVINYSFGDSGHDWKNEVQTKVGYHAGNTILIYYQEIPVATATALCDERSGQDEGYLHMVGVLSNHSGKHLGYEVSLRALHLMFDQGMKTCKLDTNDFRLPAIITYLKLGFKPVYLNDDHIMRWKKVLKKLNLERYKFTNMFNEEKDN
jgi:mycothiol synthase